MTRPFYVIFPGMSAIDAGGPSKQFFSLALSGFRASSQLFQGSTNRKLPVYSTALVSSGLFRVLGRLVTYSLLSDGPGFPYFARCVYRYIATGSPEIAAEFVTREDHLPHVSDMLSKVCVDVVMYKNTLTPFQCAVGYLTR